MCISISISIYCTQWLLEENWMKTTHSKAFGGSFNVSNDCMHLCFIICIKICVMYLTLDPNKIVEKQ